MAALQIVVLLSVGTFQATLEPTPTDPSPVFEDSAEGVDTFLKWLRPKLPRATWGQAPLKFCVVGAVPFSAKMAPYLPKPLYLSQEPLHSLEPYSATYHYVESKGQIKLKPIRTMSEALEICAHPGKQK